MGIFSMLVKLGLDSTSFYTGMKKAESIVTRFGQGVLGSVKGQLAAAFSVGAVTAFAHSVIEAADRVGDLSAQFGLTNEEVQRLEIAASRVGVPIESIGQMLAKVGEYRRKAGEGDAESLANLEKMGVSYADVQSAAVSNLQIIDKITQSYESGNRTAKDQSDVLDVTGVKAQKLLSVFEELHRLGSVKMFSDEDIASISQFKDATDEIARNMKVLVAPALGWWAQVMDNRANIEKNPDTKWYHMSTIAALAQAFTDEDGAKTPGMSKAEVAAEAARRKAAREDATRDLYEPKFTDTKSGGNRPSPAGGPLRSIGGILFDRFDDASVAKQVMRLQERTASATEKTAAALDAATSQ